MSGNKGGDLYVATVNDYIWAFLQIVVYHQFLKGGVGGDGPSKEKLKLRCPQRRTQHTGDPVVLQKVLLDFKWWDISVFVGPTSRVPKYSAHRNASPTPPLELPMKPTAPTPSTSLALVSLREPQDLMLHLCLSLSRSVLFVSARGSTTPSYLFRFLLRHCCTRIKSRREALAYSSRSLQFLQGMLGHACCHKEEMHCQNRLQLQEHPCPGIPGVWNYYKFTTPKVEKFFLPWQHWALCQRFTSQVGRQILCWTRTTSDPARVACEDWYQPYSSGDPEAWKCRFSAPVERMHHAYSLL